jgi:alpha-1,6-mannosyltransferase
VRGSKSSIVRLVLPPLAAHGALLLFFDPGRRPWTSLLLLSAAFAVFFFAVNRAEKSEAELPLRHLLLVAAGLRLLLLPLPASLSDDTLRYLWDGRVLLAGFDPYRLAPDDQLLAPLRDADWEAMPHRQVPTVYPPLAQALFLAAAALPAPFHSLKILLSAIDLLGCLLLFRLAAILAVPRARVLFYAWNPLVALETAGMGHVDALMAALAVAAVWLLARGRPGRAALAAAGAVAAKLLPLMALPIWLRRSGRPWLFGGVAALALLALFLPLFAAGPPPGLLIYAERWEFNGPIFEPLWRLIDRLDLTPRVKLGLDRLETFGGWGLDPYYRLVYPQLLAKLCLAAGLGAFLFRLLLRPPPPAIAFGRAFGAYILCSATVYPWYLVGILPFAALCRRRSWLLASALLPLAYLPRLFPGLVLYPYIHLLIWLPILLLLLREENWSFD